MGLLIISVASQNNQPPSQSGWFRISLDSGQTHTFSKSEFENTSPPYLDPEGDSLSQVKIVTLPLQGALKKNGVAISAGDIILVTEIDLNQFTYESDNTVTEGYVDSATTFLVADSGSSSFTTSPKNIYISVNYDSSTDNQAPTTVGDGEQDGNVGFTFTFTEASLTSELNPPYSDPENNPPYKLLVVSVPTHGDLLLDGVLVANGQEILFSDINLSKLVYTNREYPAGGIDGFEFQISDTISQQYTG